MYCRFKRYSRTPTYLAIVIAAVLAISESARADWCETYPGSQIYTNQNCGKPYDSSGRPQARKQGLAARPTGRSLRDILREKLEENAVQEARANKLADRITDAQNRADDALRRGSEATDAASQAQARRDYVQAMKDLSKAYDTADASIPPEKRADWQQIKQQALAEFEGRADETFVATASVSATPASTLPTRTPELFVTCDALDRKGIQTCYTAPRRGYSCTKMLFKGGDRVWTDQQPVCESTAVLEQRNRYFAKLKSPPADFGEGDRKRTEAVAAMTPQCRARLNALLEGAEKGDKEKAYGAYAALRAECETAFRKLARESDVRLPDRQLSDRARGALERAMSRDPNALVGSVDKRRFDAQYNIDEIISAGQQLTDVLSGIAGIYASRNIRSAPSAPAASAPAKTYGQGAPLPRPAPRSPPSDITGLGK